MSLTPEKVAAMLERARDWSLPTGVIRNDVDTLAVEVERLLKANTDLLSSWTVAGEQYKQESDDLRAQLETTRSALEHIAAFHGDEDCTAQLVAVARAALAKLPRGGA